jgi:hypothetical protein
VRVQAGRRRNARAVADLPHPRPLPRGKDAWEREVLGHRPALRRNNSRLQYEARYGELGQPRGRKYASRRRQKDGGESGGCGGLLSDSAALSNSSAGASTAAAEAAVEGCATTSVSLVRTGRFMAITGRGRRDGWMRGRVGVVAFRGTPFGKQCRRQNFGE